MASFPFAWQNTYSFNNNRAITSTGTNKLQVTRKSYTDTVFIMRMNVFKFTYSFIMSIKSIL